MELHGHPMSTCTRKVAFLLEEKGAPFTLHKVDIMKGEQSAPEHLARQPFGLVPVLVDGEFTLYESRAILRYLDELPGPSFTPRDRRARARMEQWISVEMSYFTPAANTVIVQKLFAPLKVTKGPRLLDHDHAAPEKVRLDAERFDKAVAQCAKTLDVLEAAIGDRAFLVDESITLADVCFLPYLDHFFAADVAHLVNDRPRVAAWTARLRARPAWKRVTERD